MFELAKPTDFEIQYLHEAFKKKSFDSLDLDSMRKCEFPLS